MLSFGANRTGFARSLTLNLTTIREGVRYLSLKFLDLGSELLCLLHIMPLGLALTVQDLQQVEVLLLQLLLLLQHLAVAANRKEAFARQLQ